MRLYGNFVAGKNRISEREYSADKAYLGDYIWSIIRILFPSTGGALTTVSSAKGNFGETLTDERPVTGLICYVTHLRIIQEKINDLLMEKIELIAIHGRESESVKNLDLAILKNKQLMRDLRVILQEKYPGFEEFRLITEHIFNAITNQQKNEKTLGYPKFIIEQILITFIILHFNDISKTERYYCELDREFFCDTICEDFSILEGAGLEEQNIWASAYGSNITSLTHNGNCKIFDSVKNEAGTINFPDCAETAMRHLITFLLWDYDTQTMCITNNEKINDFYEKIRDINDGSVLTRTKWNSIIGDLNRFSGIQELHISYEFNDVNGVEYDLNGEMLNCAKILILLLSTNTDHFYRMYLDLEENENEEKLTEFFSELLQNICGQTVVCNFEKAENNGEKFSGKYYGEMEIVIGEKLKFVLDMNMHVYINPLLFAKYPDNGCNCINLGDRNNFSFT